MTNPITSMSAVGMMWFLGVLIGLNLGVIYFDVAMRKPLWAIGNVIAVFVCSFALWFTYKRVRRG